MEDVLLKTFGTFSVNFLVLLYSFGDATENWAATFIKPVSHNLKISFSVINSSEHISVYIKLSRFSHTYCFMFISVEIHLPFSIMRASCISSQMAFNFTGEKVLP